MKLRIIKRGQYFYPQILRKNVYCSSASWIGFNIPNIKFDKQDEARTFIHLVEGSVTSKNSGEQQVVYQNFSDKKKKL